MPDPAMLGDEPLGGMWGLEKGLERKTSMEGPPVRYECYLLLFSKAGHLWKLPPFTSGCRVLHAPLWWASA